MVKRNQLSSTTIKTSIEANWRLEFLPMDHCSITIHNYNWINDRVIRTWKWELKRKKSSCCGSVKRELPVTKKLGQVTNRWIEMKRRDWAGDPRASSLYKLLRPRLPLSPAPVVGTHADSRPIFSTRRSSLAGKFAFTMMRLPGVWRVHVCSCSSRLCVHSSAGRITSRV